MNYKRTFLVLVLSILLSGSVFVLNAQDDTTTVTFRSWSPIIETTEQMIEATEERYPDINIEATIFNYPEYIVDLTTRAASDSLPDIIGLEPGALTQEYREFLMPIQDCAVNTWGEDWQ